MSYINNKETDLEQFINFIDMMDFKSDLEFSKYINVNIKPVNPLFFSEIVKACQNGRIKFKYLAAFGE